MGFLINFWGILSLNLFWTDDETIKPVGVRDIYALEYQLFQNKVWSAFYIFCSCLFMAHACIGWKKVTPALGIPKLHIPNVVTFGYIIFLVIGAVYISFPIFVMLNNASPGEELRYQGKVGSETNPGQ